MIGFYPESPSISFCLSLEYCKMFFFDCDVCIFRSFSSISTLLLQLIFSPTPCPICSEHCIISTTSPRSWACLRAESFASHLVKIWHWEKITTVHVKLAARNSNRIDTHYTAVHILGRKRFTCLRTTAHQSITEGPHYSKQRAKPFIPLFAPLQ